MTFLCVLSELHYTHRETRLRIDLNNFQETGPSQLTEGPSLETEETSANLLEKTKHYHHTSHPIRR